MYTRQMMVQTNGLAGHMHEFYELFVLAMMSQSDQNSQITASLRVTGLAATRTTRIWKKVRTYHMTQPLGSLTLIVLQSWKLLVCE